MFNKIKDFFNSFKVKPVENTPVAPYKLEPPEENNTIAPVAVVPVTVASTPVEATSKPEMIKFPKTVESDSEKPAKKPAPKRKPKPVVAKAEIVEKPKAAPAMKVVKTKTSRKPKKDDLK